MFKIWIDDENYYTDKEGKLVEVEKMPTVNNAEELLAYKYIEETKMLVLNEDKLSEIRSNKVVEPTTSERLDAIESAITELASIIGGE